MKKSPSHLTSTSVGVIVAILILVYIGYNIRLSRSDKQLEEKISGIASQLETLDSISISQPAEQVEQTIRSIGSSQLLVEEVKQVARLEWEGILKNNVSDSILERRSRIDQIFQRLGTNAAPLLPELKKELRNASNKAVATVAMSHIGGDAWPFFSNTLTNSNPQLRFAALNAIFEYAEEPVAKKAIPAILSLTNDTEFMPFIIQGLGELKLEPEKVIPALIYSLRNDTNWIVRSVAVGSLGKFAPLPIEAIEELRESASNDPHERVRQSAPNMLEDIQATQSP